MNKHLLPTAAVLALVTGNATVATANTATFGTTAPVSAKSVTAPSGTQGAFGGAVGAYKTTGGGVPGGLLTSLPTVTPLYTETMTIHVVDCCVVGDVYQVFFGATGGPLTSLGDTVPVPFNGPTVTTGTFNVAVTAGTSYTLNFADVTMQYIGFQDPYGVYVGGHTTTGTVAPTFSPTGAGFLASFSQTFTPASPTPEPATLSLLGTGLISAGLLRRRRAKKS